MLENSSYFRSRRISGNKYGPIPFRGRPELSSFSTYERRAKGLSTDLRKEGFGITLPLSCREWLKIALSKIPFSPVGGPCRITESDFYSKQGSPCPPWEQEQNMNFSACFGYRTCNEVAVQEYRAIFSSIIFYIVRSFYFTLSIDRLPFASFKCCFRNGIVYSLNKDKVPWRSAPELL